MKRYLLLIFAASLTFCSCVRNPELEIEENPGNEDVEVAVPETMDLSISAGHATKSVIDNDAKIRWVSGDQISVVFTHPEKTASVSSDFRAEFEGGPAEKATFRGTFNAEVNREAGYDKNGFAVYPHTAVDNEGNFVFELPTVQTAMAGGSFQSGFNLASASLSLEDVEDGVATADFKNALTFLRFKLDDAVKGIKFTGTSPLSGGAPLKVYFCDPNDLEQIKNHGRLQIIAGAEWSNESYDVTLMPEVVDGNFQSGGEYWYYLLVWPGEHSSLNITLDYGEPYGTYVLTNNFGGNTQAFQANKYYNLYFPSDLPTIMSNVEKKIVITEGDLNEIKNDLSGLEGTVDSLLNQVQSISLMTEYLDNAAYARYAQMTFSKHKLDVTLDYIVKPDSAAVSLVEAFNADPSVVSALLAYGKGSGMELQDDPLVVKNLYLNEVPGIGKVVTATIDAGNIDNKFYDGTWDAYVALQLANGKTDMTSDFAYLVPKAGSVITGNNLIPIVPGARVVIPFSYAVSGDGVPYTLTVTDRQGVVGATESHYDNSKTGNLTVTFADVTSGTPSVTLTLTVGEGENKELVDYNYTFIDKGDYIRISTNGDVDYIGGDAIVEVETSLGSGSLMQTGGTSVMFDNIKVFTFDENTLRQQRTANIQYSVMSNSLTYYKDDIKLIQKAYGTSLSRTYYDNGQKVTLNQADASDCSNYFNIVILGDGYKKKDLAEGGKFERSAKSAMGSFFGIEPYKKFKDRFNVYMVAYESVDEGTDSRDENNTTVVAKDTYFDTYHKPQTELWLGQGGEKVKNIVTAVVKADIYRTIAIVLVNTNENAGTSSQLDLVQDGTSYYGEPYKGFGVACVAANSTGTGGLIKHEAGGHAFGRLGDEYLDSNDSIVKVYEGDLTDAHNKGQYRNLTTYIGYWDDLMNYPGYSSVIGYVDGGMSCDKGIYRPTTGGMMFNNQGVFNAVCRRIIYERIIRQTEGAGAYSLDKFVEYDQINMPK